MSDLFPSLKSLKPDIDKVYDYPIFLENGIVGWSSTVRLKNGFAFSGGTSSEIHISRTKAIMEGFERALLNNFPPKYRVAFALDRFPSTNGFACGPSEKFAIDKAICEAAERFVWTEWVTDKAAAFEIIDKPIFTGISQFCISHFDNVKYFSIQICTSIFNEVKNLSMLAVIGFKGEGVFWGSSVTFGESQNYEHALVEAYRNLKTYSSFGNSSLELFEDKVIQKFGREGAKTFSPNTSVTPCVFKIDDWDLIIAAELYGNIWIARAIASRFKENLNKDLGKMILW